MRKYRLTAKRRRALAKARKKWKHMGHKARKKAMPNRKRRRR